MPLEKSASEKAFKNNIRKEVKIGGKKVNQAVAIAYAVRRKAAAAKRKKS